MALRREEAERPELRVIDRVDEIFAAYQVEIAGMFARAQAATDAAPGKRCGCDFCRYPLIVGRPSNPKSTPARLEPVLAPRGRLSASLDPLLKAVYSAADPFGFDATGRLSRALPRSYPVEWSEWTSTPFGDFNLGWVGTAYAVDNLAPGPILSRTTNWIDAGARLDLQARAFNRWAAKQVQEELSKRPRWRRTLARLIASSGGAHDENAPIAPREKRGVDDSTAVESWEKQQDTGQFLGWQDKLPLTRNVQVGRTTADTKDVLHVVAGFVDALQRVHSDGAFLGFDGERFIQSRKEAAVHIDEWAWNAMLIDVEWLRAIYRLSPQQAEMMSLYLQGFRQEAIATFLDVGRSSANEQLDRARKKIREIWGLSPRSAPLHMRRQSL